MIYMRYERVGNALTIKRGDTVDTISTQIASGTCTTGHFGQGVGLQTAGSGEFVDIVGYTGTPYAA